MLYECTLNGTAVVAHLESGATDCFIDPDEAKRLGLPLSRSLQNVELGDGSIISESESFSKSIFSGHTARCE